MKANRLVLLAAAVVLAVSAFHAAARTFTRSADGKTLEGEFVRMKDDKTAFIKRADGQTIELPVAILTEEDQAFIKEAAATGTPGEKKELPAGETLVALTGAHLCCGGCKKSVQSAVEGTGIENYELTITPEDVISLKAASGKDAQKALDAIAAAGYYGKSDHEAVVIPDLEASDDEQVESLTVSGVHLCCGGCVKAVTAAVEATDGAEKHTAEKDSESFEITGKFKTADLLAALRAEGLNGTVN